MKLRQVLRPRALAIVVVLALPLFCTQAAPGAVTAGTAAAASALASATSNVLPSIGCTTLANQDFSAIPGAPTAIIAAKAVAASGTTPAYCDVTGYVEPQVQFELKLPTTTWNGRYYQTGCGGFCGNVPISSCADALNQNFAVAAEDQGHVGTSELDALWGATDPQLRVDWGYRAPHVTALAAKAIIQAYYGQPARYSYFQGCSDGGREALMEAQRYPDDFDGIIAGDPNYLQSWLAGIAQNWVQRVNYTASGAQILTVDKLPALNAAVEAACGGQDGLPDGLILDPRTCHFDPAQIQCPPNADTTSCLTAAQVTVVREIYSGPVNSHGQALYPGGLPLGSELGWPFLDVAVPGQPMSAAGSFANQYLKYLAFPTSPPPSYNLNDFNFDTDVASLAKMARVYNAASPDLTAFRNHGGRLLLYHGLADPLISPYGTLAYYDQVQDLMGGPAAVSTWFRLFMFPGMYHCGGGPGLNTFDTLTPMVDWVEHGTAPAEIVATHSGSGPAMTRPVFPYPAQAHYTGSGDPNDPANYVKVIPSPLPDDDISWAGATPDRGNV